MTTETTSLHKSYAPHSGGPGVDVSQRGEEALIGADAPTRKWRALRWPLLVLVLLVLWFALLEQRPLWDPDEGRYAEIPREMLASGNWITPRLNDLLYFEKPPLQYWATGAAFQLFGLHNWSARLWSALTGLAGVLLLFYAGRRLHSTRAGLYAALMLASSLLYFGVAHVNTLDMGLTLFIEIVVFALAIGLRRETSHTECRLWIHLAWVAAGLAVLSKGLVGVVLPATALMGYSALYRDYSLWKRLSPASGAALLLLVAAPWFVAVSRDNPDFMQFFFVHEHFTRFLTTEHHRYQPWWFFLPVLALGALPWTAPMLAGLWRGFKPVQDAGFQPYGFLAVWSVVVFVFFSASSSKLFPYIVPIFPALALFGGRYACEAPPPALARQLFVSSLVPALIVGLAPYVTALYAKGHASELVQDVKIWSIIAAATWAAGGFFAFAASNRRSVDGAVIALALSAMAAHQMLLTGVEKVAPAKSSLALAREIKPHLGGSTRVYALQVYPQSLPVYLDRTVTLVNFRGELDFGLAREPQKGIPTMEVFLERWRRESDAIAVMSAPTYRAFVSAGVPMTLIGEDSARVAVRRP